MISGQPEGDSAAWRRILRAARDPMYWSTVTQAYIDLAVSRSAIELAGELRNFVYWLEQLADERNVVDPALLTAFVSEFARLASNLGQPRNERGVLSAINRAIAMQRDNDASPVDLYLAKAAYFRSIANESHEREESLKEAVRATAPESPEWPRAMGALAWYYIDVSRYSECRRIVAELRAAHPGALLPRLDCEISTLTGIAQFTSHTNLVLAAQHLMSASRYTELAEEDPEVAEWVQAAHQYLGRIAEVEGRHAAALRYYLDTLRLQRFCREDITARGFAHLRLADLLSVNRVMADAKDHLDEAQTNFIQASNVGTGQVQFDLGLATWENYGGNPIEAERIVLAARRRAAEIRFHRGELLCLGYLLALYSANRRFERLPALAGRILGTAFTGEIRRNAALVLGAARPAVRNTLRRMSQTRRAPTGEEPLSGCPCDLHDRPGPGSTTPVGANG